MFSLELFINNFISLLMEASPWLLLGLLIAGLMKAWLPSHILSRHLGQGKLAIIKAAFIGAPLPLCSCGVIPVATELRRSGASKSATASFLVATPETGVDSITVSYALLGPLFAIYRPITAISSAIITGLLVTTDKTNLTDIPSQNNSENTVSTSSCCASEKMSKPAPTQKTSCCSNKTAPTESIKQTKDDNNLNVNSEKSTNDSCCNKTKQPSTAKSSSSKTLLGIRYASTQLIDDLAKWLLLGLIFATCVQTFVPESFLTNNGSGLIAMLLVILISIPMYICATASTPIAAGLIMAGISPGTALVFMLAGPATNISTLAIIYRELGRSTLLRYLVGVAGSAIAFGYLLDWLINFYHIDIQQGMVHSHELVPHSIAIGSSVLLTFLAIKPLRKWVIKY